MNRILRCLISALFLTGLAAAAQIELEWQGGGKEKWLEPCQTTVIDVRLTLQAGENAMAATWFVLADEDGQTAPGPDPLDFEVTAYGEPLVGWDYDWAANDPLPMAKMNEANGEYPVGTKKGLHANLMDLSLAGIDGPTSVVIASYTIHCTSISEDVIYFNTHELYLPLLTSD